ncbi:MAG: metal-dependent hydrolase [Stenotrophobium sp.]
MTTATATPAITATATRKRPPFPVRRMSFDYAESSRYWFDGNPFFTHFMNAMSGIFPQGELYLIESLRQIREGIKDPVLQAEIGAFIGQEAWHSKEHTAFNRYADEQGIDIATSERRMLRLYKLMRKVLPIKHNMAVGCAIEHVTATLGAAVLRREDWSERIKGPVGQLWLWHAVEENEHKAVFMDAYEAIGGAYGARVFYMATAGGILAVLILRNMLRLLWADGKLSAPQFLKFVWEFFGPKGIADGRVVKEFLDYYRPGFHPYDHDTLELQQHWRQRMNLAEA